MEQTKKHGLIIIRNLVFIFFLRLFSSFAIFAPNFLSSNNVINILRQVSMFGIVVVGVSAVMIGGGMDLSVGGQMAVVGMILGYLMVNLNLGIVPAILIGILTGCIFGSLNGILAIKLHMAPIIVTLSMMLVFARRCLFDYRRLSHHRNAGRLYQDRTGVYRHHPGSRYYFRVVCSLWMGCYE